MRTLSTNALDYLLHTKEGLRELVAMAVAEDDPVDFKVALNLDQRDRKAARELRADCAALATAGTGFLVVGVDESRDGRNVAERLVGVETSKVAAIKCRIEDLLGSGIHPALGPNRRHVRIVDLGGDRCVIVVRVTGREGYPALVADQHGGEESGTFYVREAGKKKALTNVDGIARRERADHRCVLVVGAAALVALAAMLAPALGVVAWQNAGLRAQVKERDTAVAGLTAQVERITDDARARTVDVEALAGALRSVPGASVEVNTAHGDVEAHHLAQEIRRAALVAGWAADAVGSAVMAGPPVDGIRIYSAGKTGDPAPACAAVLAKWLEKHGLGPVEVWPGKSLTSNQVRIFVGAKRRTADPRPDGR